jgi:hypothetical protein
MLFALVMALSLAAQTRADTYTANLVIVAGQQARPANEPIDFVINTQRRLMVDVGVLHATLNPDKAKLTAADGTKIDAIFQPVMIADTDRQIGTRITFRTPQKLAYLSHLPLKLTFEDVGAELVGNHPDLPDQPVAESYRDVDYAVTQRGGAWDLDRDDSQPIAEPWHATTQRSDDGTLIATADGTYSSPLIGSIAGPIDGSYSRIVIRARREGPTEVSRVLVNNKSYPKDAQGETQLKETFDIYTVDMTSNPEWGERPEKLFLRWGHNAQPTAKDKIIIDWVRLYRAPSFEFLSAIHRAQDAASFDQTASQGGKLPPMRAQAPAGDQPRRDTIKAFFAPPVDRGADLPANKIYPQGRQLGFSLYSVGGGIHPITPEGEHLPALIQDDETIAAAFERVKGDHATMAGGQYEINYRLPQDAQRAGLHCIYTIGSNRDGTQWRNFAHNRNVEFDPDTVRQRVREAVEAVAHYESIAWWDLTPEELRWWRADEMQYMQIMYETIREADPLKRPIFMYEPNNRGAESLAKTLKFQDICGRGVYANYAGHKDTRGPWIRWAIEQEIEAIKLSGRSHAIPVAVPEMFQQPADEDLKWVPLWPRHDTYLSLITGAKGVLVFSYRVRVNFPAHDDYYEGFASVSREVCGPLNLADVFLFGEVRGDLDMQITSGPKSVLLPSSGKDASVPPAYPSISFVDIAHGPHRYLIAVNSSYEAVETQVTGLPDGKVQSEALFAGGRDVITDRSFNATFAPMEVKAWRFSATD